MNGFYFFNPVKVYFGKDQLIHLPAELNRYGGNVLLVYGGGSIKRNGIYQKVVNQLSDFRITEFSGIEPNPDVESVRRGVVLCKEKKIDVILAVGGGSVIDAAKWIAVSACVEHDPWDFFCKKTTIGNALPIITVVTIASTGSEMNNGGVLSNRELARKTGRGSPAMFPKASFLNPEFTYAVNGYQTACGVVDIISHVMEVYFTQQEGMSLLNGIMESMVRTVVKYGKVAIGDPENYEARANLLYAASWAINGFINGPVRQPWNCHTIEHELSARYPIPHGHGMAILLPRWLKYCFQAGNRALYETCARDMFSIDGGGNSADALTERMEKLFYEELGLKPTLKDLNVPHDALEDIAASICAQGSIKGFTELDGKDVRLILEKCF